ncbi:hypothetical protein SADUNF_Sadunf13G0076000 [Salix dunnii]|uniref:Reverse transcriptase Ty1/copia-type domain-containing protein n=1 Tax=Salix dunnii TaxID=1413687 RepID=A0A835MLY1_9ROSI|nr:hypothetical protein SADUNF_Sadunf13G0076000 [Salix dunnii]
MNNIHKPMQLNVVSKHNLPPPLEPTCMSQALSHLAWRVAMSAKLTTLMRHDTWTLLPPPKDCNLVGCKWVFRIKYTADGSIDKFKARLVAKGFHHRIGFDFKETFSSVL